MSRIPPPPLHPAARAPPSACSRSPSAARPAHPRHVVVEPQREPPRPQRGRRGPRTTAAHRWRVGQRRLGGHHRRSGLQPLRAARHLRRARRHDHGPRARSSSRTTPRSPWPTRPAWRRSRAALRSRVAAALPDLGDRRQPHDVLSVLAPTRSAPMSSNRRRRAGGPAPPRSTRVALPSRSRPGAASRHEHRRDPEPHRDRPRDADSSDRAIDVKRCGVTPAACS